MDPPSNFNTNVKITWYFQVVFHYEMEPQGDHVFYHQWWDDVIHDYPFLYIQKIDQSELDVCHGPTDIRIKYVAVSIILKERGYVTASFCGEGG